MTVRRGTFIFLRYLNILSSLKGDSVLRLLSYGASRDKFSDHDQMLLLHEVVNTCQYIRMFELFNDVQDLLNLLSVLYRLSIEC
jgi:hypothetical protein